MTELGKIAPELAEAQNQVEMHRMRLDESLHDLQRRLELGREGLKKITESAQKVDALAEESPLLNVGVFLLAGYLLGGMIAKKREATAHGASPIAEPGSNEPPAPLTGSTPGF